MKKKLILCTLWLAAAVSCFAQSTTVTATVPSFSGGSVVATFVNGGGGNPTTTTVTKPINSSGTFTMTVATNTAPAYAPSQWQFAITAQVPGINPTTYTADVTITGNQQDISNAFRGAPSIVALRGVQPNGSDSLPVAVGTGLEFDGNTLNANGSSGGATFPETQGLVVNTSQTDSRTATASDVTQTMTGATSTPIAGSRIAGNMGGTYSLLYGLYPGGNFFGDSNCTGAGTSPYNGDPATPSGWLTAAPNSIVSVLAPTLNGTVLSYCKSGDQAADTSTIKIWLDTISYTNQPPSIVNIGTNDQHHCGATAGCENNYQAALNAIVQIRGTPTSSLVTAQSCSKTGTWTNSAIATGTLAAFSPTPNATMTCSITTYGGPIYIGYGAADTAGGSFTVAIDGTPPCTTITSAGFNGQSVTTQNGTTTVIFGTKCSASAGSHTVVFTKDGTTNNGMVAYVTTPLGNPGFTPSNKVLFPPSILLQGILKEYQDQESAGTAAYNTIVQNTVSAFKSDGLPVMFLDVRGPYINFNSSTDFNCGASIPQLHYCNAGGLQYRDELAQQIQPLGAIGAAVSSAVSSFNTRTGAVTPQSGDYSCSLVTNALCSNAAGTITAGTSNIPWSISSANTTSTSYQVCNTTAGAHCWLWYTDGSGNAPGWSGYYDVTDGGNAYSLADFMILFNAGFANCWSSTTNNPGSYSVSGSTADVCEWRDSPGVMDLGNKTPKDKSGIWQFGGLVGPATAPTGSCALLGEWVFSHDGAGTFCNGTTWVQKIAP